MDLDSQAKGDADNELAQEGTEPEDKKKKKGQDKELKKGGDKKEQELSWHNLGSMIGGAAGGAIGAPGKYGLTAISNAPRAAAAAVKLAVEAVPLSLYALGKTGYAGCQAIGSVITGNKEMAENAKKNLADAGRAMAVMAKDVNTVLLKAPSGVAETLVEHHAAHYQPKKKEAEKEETAKPTPEETADSRNLQRKTQQVDRGAQANRSDGKSVAESPKHTVDHPPMTPEYNRLVEQAAVARRAGQKAEAERLEAEAKKLEAEAKKLADAEAATRTGPRRGGSTGT